jgi:hypothetical protein
VVNSFADCRCEAFRGGPPPFTLCLTTTKGDARHAQHGTISPPKRFITIITSLLLASPTLHFLRSHTQPTRVQCDSAQPWQLGFQDPATPIMEGIVDLHHDVMFFLVIICIFVLYLLIRVAVLFRPSKNNFVKIVHGKVIEVA